MNGTSYFVNRYQEVDINTANPLQLVVILYDAAVRSLEEAHRHMQRNDVAGRTRAINKCNDIISELQSSLNLQEGGEIAGSLNRLYDYMKRTLFKAGAEQNQELVAEVAKLLENLRSAWRQVVEANAAPSVPSEATVPPDMNLSEVNVASEASQIKSFSISA